MAKTQIQSKTRKRISWKLEAELKDREIENLKSHVDELEKLLKSPSQTPLLSSETTSSTTEAKGSSVGEDAKPNSFTTTKKEDVEASGDGSNPPEAEAPLNTDESLKKEEEVTEPKKAEEPSLNTQPVDLEIEEEREEEPKINKCGVEGCGAIVPESMICPNCGEDYN